MWVCRDQLGEGTVSHLLAVLPAGFTELMWQYGGRPDRGEKTRQAASGPSALFVGPVCQQCGHMAQRLLGELTRDECFRLLGHTKVGRLVYTDLIGPLAVPVNYSVAGESVVFRLEPGNSALPISQPVLAFEVDQIDHRDGSGWSVLVRGSAHEVRLDDVPTLLKEMPSGPPRPWAEGVHSVWVRLDGERVTGRLLGSFEPPLVM